VTVPALGAEVLGAIKPRKLFCQPNIHLSEIAPEPRANGRNFDQFVDLKDWSKKAETSRRVAQVFPVILGIDRKLKILRKMDRLHPLQELAAGGPDVI
jgi:hypothetical protein